MEEINWDRIDKQKFFLQGVGLFSGVTSLLFPLSVVKTRQMASHGVPAGFQGMKQTVSSIWREEGVPGFYRGFGTVVFGTIPSRMVYLGSLEMTKDWTTQLAHQLQLSSTATAGFANFAGGAAASLSIQLVAVPIDVISQRQMVHGSNTSSRPRTPPSTDISSSKSSSGASSSSSTQQPVATNTHARPFSTYQHPAQQGIQVSSHITHSTQPMTASTTASWYKTHSRLIQSVRSSSRSVSHDAAIPFPSQRVGGIEIARKILQEEGIRGLYRGFGMSVATFVPSSAVWWSAYGVYQQVLSHLYLRAGGRHQPDTQTPAATQHQQLQQPRPSQHEVGDDTSLSRQEVLGVQLASALLAGGTASLITNPLDLIKTRIQVAIKSQQQAHSVKDVLEEILREDGAAGLLRGVLPRMVSSAAWGSAMVMVYEFLKRISVKEDGQ